jgi:hypothetical protein
LFIQCGNSFSKHSGTTSFDKQASPAHDDSVKNSHGASLVDARNHKKSKLFIEHLFRRMPMHISKIGYDFRLSGRNVCGRVRPHSNFGISLGRPASAGIIERNIFDSPV